MNPEQKTQQPKPKRTLAPGMLIGIIVGTLLGAGLQWIRDGGVVQGAVIGLVLGLTIGLAFSARQKANSANN